MFAIQKTLFYVAYKPAKIMPSGDLSICQFVNLSICRFGDLPICRFVDLVICRFVDLVICQFVDLVICQFVDGGECIFLVFVILLDVCTLLVFRLSFAYPSLFLYRLYIVCIG